MVCCFAFFQVVHVSMKEKNCLFSFSRDGLQTHCLTVSFKAFSVFTFLEIWAQNYYSFRIKATLVPEAFLDFSPHERAVREQRSGGLTNLD